MREILLKQSRVCDILRSAGLEQAKKADRDLFLKHYKKIPALLTKTTSHRPAKSGRSRWYVYETDEPLTVAQAEQEVAREFGKILGIVV